MTSHRLLARLYQDLAELRDSPYPGVEVFTDEVNFRKLCLVLTPPSGPWKDLSLHFDVSLPEEWPVLPPKVSTSVIGIKHPNLFGDYICCDLLKSQEEMYAERGYTGGYTPALTLRGLFLQFLTFFSSTSVEQSYGGSYFLGDHTHVYYHMKHPGAVRRPDNQPPTEKELESLWNNTTSLEFTETDSSRDTISHKVKVVENGQLHRVERFNNKWRSTLNLVSHFKCRKCPYGSPTLPHHRGVAKDTPSIVLPASLLQPPTTCVLDGLTDDCMYEISHRLPEECLISLSHAYPRFRAIMDNFHVLLRRELRCFFLRVPLTECILGIGIALDTGARTLSSDFDWLSLEAFDMHQVRLSIEKRRFDYFLPLAFSHTNFVRVVPDIRKRLAAIDLGLRQAEATIEKRTGRKSNRRTSPPLKPYDTVEVLYRMMNSIVVSLMKSCDDTVAANNTNMHRNQTLLFASEKAVTSYCLLLHLLMCLCRSQPQILSDATTKLQRFISNPETRQKQTTSDLGELIVIITLVLIMPPVHNTQPITWDRIRGPFIQEAVTRNVRWMLNASPELQIMERGPSDYRLSKTFDLSKTSLRLIMFQVTFLNIFLQTYRGDIARLDENYGFAEKGMPERMVMEIKKIYLVEDWPQYFERVKFGKVLSKEVFSQMLRDTVQESARKGYHRPPGQMRIAQLRRLRTELDKNVMFG